MKFVLPRSFAPSYLPLTKLLGFALICFSLVLLSRLTFEEWIKPSFVGVLWGGIFCTGFLFGNEGRGSAWFLPLAASFLIAANAALVKLTAIGPMDSLMAFSTILAAGWLTSTLDPMCQNHSPMDRRGVLPENQACGKRKWGICDIGFVTVIVACFVRAAPDLAAGPFLLMGLFIALFIGLLMSWVACRIAWSNEWPLRSLLVVAAPFLFGLFWMIALRPGNVTMIQAVRWLLTGPSSILAAQSTTVLVLLAVLRLELRRAELAPARGKDTSECKSMASVT